VPCRDSDRPPRVGDGVEAIVGADAHRHDASSATGPTLPPHSGECLDDSAHSYLQETTMPTKLKAAWHVTATNNLKSPVVVACCVARVSRIRRRPNQTPTIAITSEDR
jgi:hypothetical protein